MGKHQVRGNMVHASCWTEIYGVKEGNKGTSRLLSREEHGPVLHYLGLGSYFKVWTCKPNSRAVTTSQPNSHSKPNAPAWNRFYYYSYVTFSFIKLPWIYFKLFFFGQASVFKYHSNSENRSFLLIQWTSISVLKCMLIWLELCWLKKQRFLWNLMHWHTLDF